MQLVSLHEVENAVLEVVMNGDLYRMDEDRHWKVTHNTGTMSKHIETLVHMGRNVFGISCLGVGSS
jgi:hypothetical protein